MSCLRFELSLAIPEDPNGTLILATTDEDGNPVGGIRINSTLASKLPEIKTAIQRLKALSININEGQPNEEKTTRAIYRICYHDEGEGHKVDEPEQEI